MSRPSKPAVSSSADDRLFNVAHSMLLTAIGTRGAVPSGDEIRQFVREAREFMSELSKPTPRKPKGQLVDVGRRAPDAELNDLDDDSPW